MVDVKGRGSSRVSSKNQITIPVSVLRAAGIGPGDPVEIRADGAGRVSVVRRDDVVAGLAGSLTGVYERDEVDRLRDEWR